MHSDGRCVLMAVVRPFLFKVITDIVGLIATTFVTVFCPLCLFFLFVSYGFHGGEGFVRSICPELTSVPSFLHSVCGTLPQCSLMSGV